MHAQIRILGFKDIIVLKCLPKQIDDILVNYEFLRMDYQLQCVY